MLEKYAPIAYTTLSACDHLSFKKSAYGVLPIGVEAVNSREQKKRRTGRKRTLMPPPPDTHPVLVATKSREREKGEVC